MHLLWQWRRGPAGQGDQLRRRLRQRLRRARRLRRPRLPPATVAGTVGQVCATGHAGGRTPSATTSAPCACPGGQAARDHLRRRRGQRLRRAHRLRRPRLLRPDLRHLRQDLPGRRRRLLLPDRHDGGLQRRPRQQLRRQGRLRRRRAAPSQACRVRRRPATSAASSGTSVLLQGHQPATSSRCAAGVTRGPADGIATTRSSPTSRTRPRRPPGAVGGATINFSTAPLGSVAPASAITDVGRRADGEGHASPSPRRSPPAPRGHRPLRYGDGLSRLRHRPPSPPRCSARSASPTSSTRSLGARDSGYQESSELTFAAARLEQPDLPGRPDRQLRARPAGRLLHRRRPPACVTTIGPRSAPPAASPTSTGKVKVILHSGRIAGVVSVLAKAQAGGSGLKTFTAGNIAIVGGQGQRLRDHAQLHAHATSRPSSTRTAPTPTTPGIRRLAEVHGDAGRPLRPGPRRGHRGHLRVGGRHRGRLAGHHPGLSPPPRRASASAFVKVTRRQAACQRGPLDAGWRALAHSQLGRLPEPRAQPPRWPGHGDRQGPRRGGVRRRLQWLPRTASTRGRARAWPAAPRAVRTSSTWPSRSSTTTTTGNAAILTRPTTTSTTTVSGTAPTTPGTPTPPSGPRLASSTPTTWRRWWSPPPACASTQYASRFYTAQVPPQATSTVQFTGVAAVVPAQPGPPPVPAIPATSHERPPLLHRHQLQHPQLEVHLRRHQVGRRQAHRGLRLGRHHPPPSTAWG